MNLQITNQERFQLIDGINARIQTVEKLIQTFQSMLLVAEYTKERESLIALKNKLFTL